MNYLLLTCIATLLTAVSVGAEETTQTEFDLILDTWEGVIMTNESEMSLISHDADYQAEADVFPEVTIPGAGTVGRLRDERAADFVSAQIDGKLVIFTDIPRYEWFAPYVRAIAERGIVSGYRDATGKITGQFGPHDPVTLAQLSKVMINSGGHDISSCGKSTINATASGTWAAPYVSCAEAMQWAVYGDGTVDVGRPATRAEVIMTLVQTFNKTVQPRTGTGFTDVSLSTLYGGAIEQAKYDGIVSGYTNNEGVPNGLFGPNDPVTRAELSKIVSLGLAIYNAKPVKN